ncbi:Carbohydrate isomerase%2C KpsF/GutQ family [Chlamydia trachomatis]|nr:Carbohydrate isomerase%2C KpsF/GutQ family [Chlamydia trachomatis]
MSEYGGDILAYPLQQIMTRNPKVISEDSDVLLSLEMMESGNPVTVLPVVDAQQQRFIVGLLHMHALARAGLL